MNETHETSEINETTTYDTRNVRDWRCADPTAAAAVSGSLPARVLWVKDLHRDRDQGLSSPYVRHIEQNISFFRDVIMKKKT